MSKFDQIVKAVEGKMGNNYKAEYHKVRKNNGTIKNGIYVFEKEKGKRMSPIIYIDDLIDKLSVEEISEIIIRTFKENENHMEYMSIADKLKEFPAVKDMLSVRLINKRNNTGILGMTEDHEILFEEFFDLAIIVTINLDVNATIKVNNLLLRTWNIPFEDVLRIAKMNFYASGKEFIPMSEMLANISGMGSQEIEIIEPLMYILTNNRRMFAAGVITNEEIMGGICKKLDSDLIVIPSSVHEVIILPYTNDLGIGYIRQMVDEVGRYCWGYVEYEEKLEWEEAEQYDLVWCKHNDMKID